MWSIVRVNLTSLRFPSLCLQAIKCNIDHYSKILDKVPYTIKHSFAQAHAWNKGYTCMRARKCMYILTDSVDVEGIEYFQQTLLTQLRISRVQKQSD